MTLFKGFRAESHRCPKWNYASAHGYFITICTRFGKHDLGEIVDGKLLLKPLGEEVERQWLLTPEIRTDMNLRLDSFQVMPNHFHAIILIGKNPYNHFRPIPDKNAGSGAGASAAPRAMPDRTIRTDAMLGVSPKSPSDSEMEFRSISPINSFGPQRKNLGSIIRGFKSSVTTFARHNGIPFKWHPDFHDNIIRDEHALRNIRKYIQNNVANWERDRFRRRGPK